MNREAGAQDDIITTDTTETLDKIIPESSKVSGRRSKTNKNTDT